MSADPSTLLDVRLADGTDTLILAMLASTTTKITGVNTLTVDPINGNDLTGGFNAGPIQTIAKLNQLMAGLLISAGTLTVNVTSSPPASDAELDLTINYQNAINNPFFGAGQGAIPFLMLGAINNTALTGTLATAVMPAYAIPPAAPIRGTITDLAVANWAPFAFQLITITSGARGPTAPMGGPASAWIYPSAAPTNANICTPEDKAGFPWGFVAGDPYAVVNLPQVKVRQITVIGDKTGNAHFVNLEFPQWATAKPATNAFAMCVTNLNGQQGIVFGTCKFDVQPHIQGNQVALSNCLNSLGWFGGDILLLGGITVWNGSVTQGTLSMSNALFTKTANFNGVNLWNTGTISAFRQPTRHAGFPDGGIQVWDWPTKQPGIQINGVTVQLEAPLYGASTAANTVGVEVLGNGALVLIQEPPAIAPATPVPNVVGQGSYVTGSDTSDTDFVLDDTLNAAGTPVARAWEEGAGTFTAQIACKWATLLVAQPAGFDAAPADPSSRRNAQTLATGSRISNGRAGD